MEDYVSFFVIIIFITILYIHLETKSLDVKYVKSKIDNNVYLVRDLKDKEEAANLLATIRNNLTKIVEYLKNNIDLDKKSEIDLLIKNYRPEKISESSPNNSYTSYSINKGEKIVFCLRSKDYKNTLVKEEIMMFVAIHELAHLMTESIGHTPEFWENMKYLLRVGKKLNINLKTNYNSQPVSYCGTKITDSPLK